jgi:hypothetical protein
LKTKQTITRRIRVLCNTKPFANNVSMYSMFAFIGEIRTFNKAFNDKKTPNSDKSQSMTQFRIRRQTLAV